MRSDVPARATSAKLMRLALGSTIGTHMHHVHDKSALDYLFVLVQRNKPPIYHLLARCSTAHLRPVARDLYERPPDVCFPIAAFVRVGVRSSVRWI
jgi:hypothetical protein